MMVLPMVVTKRRPCDSRWKLKLLKNRPPQKKLRLVKAQKTMLVVKRRRRPTNVARKKSSSASRRKNKRGRGKRTLKPTR